MPRKFKIKSLLILFTLLIFLRVSQVSAYPLDITVSTDKNIYNVGETVNINGTLLFYGQIVTNNLIAIQINDRIGYYLIRTIIVGNPIGPWKAEITDVYIGDAAGKPLTEIQRGTICYIYIYFKNSYDRELNITIAYTIYDCHGSPIYAHIPVSGKYLPGEQMVVCGWQIPTYIDLGPLYIYASIFDETPKNGGVPYSPERSNYITVKNIQTQDGFYTLSFPIAKKETRIGNYTVYVSSFYQGFKAKATTSYQVILLGDINGDLCVNVKDGIILGRAFNSKVGDPRYDPRCDLNQDGYINVKDSSILGKNFGNTAQ